MGVWIPGSVRQYMSGLWAATLGLCAAGWLALAPVAFGYRDGAAGPARAALHRALLADRGTAAALAVVSLVTLLAWIVAWRRRLRADGVLTGTSWREARALRRRARAQELAAAQEQAAADAVAAPAADETPDPARVLSELRALLIPLLAESDAAQAVPGGDEPGAPQPAVNEPAVHQPAMPESVIPEPAADEPAADEPVAREPVAHEPAGAEPGRGEPAAQGPAVPLPRPGGLAAMESMLAGAELLTVACGEEEAW